MAGSGLVGPGDSGFGKDFAIKKELDMMTQGWSGWLVPIHFYMHIMYDWCW